MVQMLGWLSAEAARASRRKRCRQGHRAAQLGIFGLVDYPHAAAAEFFYDAIVGDRLADQLPHPGLGWALGQTLGRCV
jgi:hypothetical protein